MKTLECFAGIGGMAEGFRRAGFEHIQFVEQDPFCQAVLRKHWPSVEIHGDIRTFSAIPFRGVVDVVTGGPPCQPTSVAGKRKGSTDDRWLWPEFLRIVRECSPRWIVAENPPGIITLEPHGLDWILEELEEAGYQPLPVVMGAKDVGAPHKRDRVWIVAHATVKPDRPKILSGEAIRQNPGRSAGRTSGSSAVAHRESGRLGELRGARNEGNGGDTDGSRAGMEHAAISGLEGCREGLLGFSSLDDPDLSRPGNAGQVNEGDGQYGQGEPVGRTAWPAGPGCEQYEWEPPRTISRLCRSVDGISARMDSRERRNRLKALGNAVVPQNAEVIARAILEAERMAA